VNAVEAGPALVVAAGVALGSSWVLVWRLERVGERLGLSEALLGLVAALAADAPEITAAVTALRHHQPNVGAGVVLGSCPFNLAALLGLGAVVAGRIRLHRRVVVFGGAVALSLAVVALLTVRGDASPGAGLTVSLIVLGSYIVALGTGLKGRRLPLAGRFGYWLQAAAVEEEAEMEEGVLPPSGTWVDALVAAVSLVVVVGASVVMEHAAVSLGRAWSVPDIVVGAIWLGAITSLPNAVAAIYLVRKGRGAATFSTALNSNNLNVIAGLLIPATVLGLGEPSGDSALVAWWFVALTALTLLLAYRGRGLTRATGILIIVGYAAFTASVVGSASG
jgi:cation:H+ antiporter